MWKCQRKSFSLKKNKKFLLFQLSKKIILLPKKYILISNFQENKSPINKKILVVSTFLIDHANTHLAFHDQRDSNAITKCISRGDNNEILTEKIHSSIIIATDWWNVILS